ncbi:MAG: quinol:electron acceptor oxidoreductase subunit ActD [Vicinamibacterales bacterium]
MTAMYGLYEEPGGAQRAFTALRRAGVAEADITVISAEPFEAFEFAERDKSLILFRLAGIGGVLGLTAGLFLTIGTETAWPLVTGGMPIVAWWPNLVIIFELTMLGAILTTVVSLLVTAGLPTLKGAMYDPAVSDGKILVGVPLSAGRAPDTVRDALTLGGALTVKTADF